MGKSGYAPVCANEWAPRSCGKPRIKCGACPNQAFREAGLVFCLPGDQREVIAGLAISLSMCQCAGHGDVAGPGFVH